MKIGFVGLGIMGKPMAKNLIQAGHDLLVFNRSQGAVKELVEYGATAAPDLKSLAENSEIIITMLPDSPDVEKVLTEEAGILSGVKPGTIIIDVSSILPEISQKLFAKAKEKQASFLDAPVSGGEEGAIKASLTIMVGGEKQAFDAVNEAVLLKMGAKTTYCGASGAGSLTKLVNNMIVASNIAICAEAFTMSSKAGIDPNQVFSAVRYGMAGSVVLDKKMPQIIEQNYTPGFKLDLHMKDLNNAIKTAEQMDIPIPITNLVSGMMEELMQDGYEKSDSCVIAKYYEKRSKTIIGKE